MENEKMGQFIAALRKSNHMTQKDLAEKLHVSDKAVSKWERGLSCPDVSLLLPLSDILGVTVAELLNGEKTVNMQTSIKNALEYGVKATMDRVKMTQNIWSAVFSLFLLLSIIVVALTNLMVSDKFTWSLIPISACVFAWLVFFPAIKFGRNGIIGSFISISIFLIPFLYVLDYAINSLAAYHAPVFSMGISIAPLLIVFFWIAFFLFQKLRARKLLYSAVLLLLLSPVTFLTNFFLDITQGQAQTWFNTLSILNALIPFVAAIILFVISYVKFHISGKTNEAARKHLTN